MRKFKFRIDVGVPECIREIIDEFDDEVNEEDLDEYAQELISNYVEVFYDEIK